MLLSSLLLAAMLSVSPAGEDATLASLRKAHDAALKAKFDSLAKKEVAAMRALEKSLVERQDYEGAIKVVQKMAEMEKSSATSSLANKAVIRLDAEAPHLAGFGINERNQVFHLIKNNGSIRWENATVKPGIYEVQITYVVGEKDLPKPAEGSSRPDPAFGGSITFGEISNLNSTPPLKLLIPLTKEPLEMTTAKLGRIEVVSSRSSFTLKVTNAETDGVMFLRRIELVPAALGDTELPAAELKELTALREEYRKQLKEKTGAAQKYWLTKLQELQTQAEQSSNSEALALIKSELTRMQALASTAASPSTSTTSELASVILSATDPILTSYKGEIRVSESRDCLQRLRPVGARVSFKLATAKVPPGKYQVSLDLNIGLGMGGEYRIACGASVLTGELEAPKAYLRKSLPLEAPLTIAAGVTYLEFEVVSLNSSTGSLGDLRALILKPIND